MDVFQVQLPGPLSLLRMMRAFRVFRLFKRVQSLKKILDSLTKALPSHINSFGILLLVMCIYAILAVDFFMNYGGEGFYTTNLNDTIDATTTRGLSWGYDYYGNFGLSLFTMFQVITGDSWSEAVARPLVHGQDGVLAFGSAMYFISFQLVCGVVLINVTIAILLEKMVDDGSEKMEAAQQEAQRRLLEGIDLDKLPIEVLDGAISGSLTGDALGEAGEMLEMEGEVQQMRRDLLVLRKGLKDVLVTLQKPEDLSAIDELEVASVTESTHDE